MLIVDTGPLVALGDSDDQHHSVCRELLETDPGPLVTTALVIAETGYLLNRVLGPSAEIALLDMILDDSLNVEPLDESGLGTCPRADPHLSRPQPRRH